MSGGIDALQLKEEDVVKLLAAGVHLGASNVDYQMESYVYKRKPDGKTFRLFISFALLGDTKVKNGTLPIHTSSALGCPPPPSPQ